MYPHPWGFLAYALMGVGLRAVKPDPRTKEQRLLDRLDRAEARALEIQRRRAASPEVAAAEAKRARKAAKRLNQKG